MKIQMRHFWYVYNFWRENSKIKFLAIFSTRMVTTIYFNGEKMFTQLHDTPNGLNKWFAEGEWFLGQDQDELGGSFEKQQSLSGVLSNVNVWSRILTDKEVERMSKCFDSPLGLL